MNIKLIILLLIGIAAFTLYSCSTYRAINENKSDNYYFNFYKTKVHYIPMGNWFELGNDILENVDVKTVQVLGENYIKDKSHVYYKATPIRNADVSSFKILCSGFASYARDKNMVYYEGYSFQNMDIDSFCFAGDTCGSVLMDNHHVYSIYTLKKSINDNNGIIKPIAGVSPERYHQINNLYGKDDENVYCKGRAIDHANARTFALISEYYARDTSNIYYDGLKIEGLDANTFMLIEGGSYSKDKNGVYYGLTAIDNDQGEPIRYTSKQVVGADPETFEMIMSDKVDYAKDKTKHYWGGVAE